MDKQKQIEEMARDIAIAGKVASEWLCEETKSILREKGNFKSTEHTKTLSDIVAEELAKMGYRKITELPKDTVLTADDIAELLTIVARDTRKETAEKFAERLKELVADRNCNEDYEWEDVQVDGQIFIECVDEICKEISEGKV